jgi:hypothetical protein
MSVASHPSELPRDDVRIEPCSRLRNAHLSTVHRHARASTATFDDELSTFHHGCKIRRQYPEVIHVSSFCLNGDLTIVLVDVCKPLSIPIEYLDHCVRGHVYPFGAADKLDTSVAERFDVALVRDDVSAL